MVRSKNQTLTLAGYVMLIIGAIVLLYVLGDKLDIIDLVPPDPVVPVVCGTERN